MNYTIKQLCQFAGFSLAELQVSSRKHDKAYARFCVMEYLNTKLNYSLSKCASVFNIKSHLAVINGISQINNPRNPLGVYTKERFLRNISRDQNIEIFEMPFIYDSLIDEYYG